MKLFQEVRGFQVPVGMMFQGLEFTVEGWGLVVLKPEALNLMLPKLLNRKP